MEKRSRMEKSKRNKRAEFGQKKFEPILLGRQNVDYLKTRLDGECRHDCQRMFFQTLSMIHARRLSKERPDDQVKSTPCPL